MSTSVNFKVPRAIEIAERKPAIAEAVAGISRYVDQAIAEAAEALDRTNIDEANVQVAMAAINAVLPLLYKSRDGKHYNIDETTRRIDIPLPWCADGWKRWGLRLHSQARVLNKILRHRQHVQRTAMFVYGRQRWYVSPKYSTIEQACEYWRVWPVTREEWNVSI